MVHPRCIRTLSRLGLLAPLDRAAGVLARLRSAASNRRLRRGHPTLRLPPADLAWDSYHHVDGVLWRSTGAAHAEVFLRCLESERELSGARVLEWGCGPARILVPMSERLAARGASLTGCDCNPASVAFCRAMLPGLEVFAHGPRPPLPLDDGVVDVVYAWSVLTHLSVASQIAWVTELARVLAPGGLLLVSTHGDAYRRRLTRTERIRYDAGEPVVTRDAPEGSKWCCAHHPPCWMAEGLLAGWTVLRHEPGSGTGELPQDLWLARRSEPERAGEGSGSGSLDAR